MVPARGLVGRTAELVALRASCDPAHAGLTGVVLEGPAGIGKTALWEAAAAVTAEAGCRVLACRTSQAEADLPFTALGDLLHPLAGELDALPGPQARALRVALLLEEPGNAPVDQRAVGLALVGLLRAGGPTAMFMDDVQWLDGPTASVLAFALRRLHDAHLLVVASLRREGRGGAQPEVVASLGDALRVIRVRPLDDGAMHRLLRDELGSQAPRALVMRITELAGGNPLHAIELARAGAGADALSEGLPETLRQLVADRVDGLPPSAREALAAVAAVAEPTAALIDEVVGDPEPRRTAQDAGVLAEVDGRVRFTHPLLAGAVERLEPGRRRALHRRIAAALEDPVARARHLGLAAVPPDPAVAATLEAAAGLAAARGAPFAGAGLAGRAVELTPPGEVQRLVARTILASRLQYAAGDERVARLLLERTRAAIPAGPERAEILLHLTQLEDVSIREGLQIMEQALSEAGPDPGRRALLLVAKSELLSTQLQWREGLACAREAVDLAAAAGDAALQADALTHVAMLGAPLCELDPEPLYERAIALTEEETGLDSWWHPRFARARAGMWNDDLARATPGLEDERAGALRRGDEHARQNACVALVELECRRGDLAAARRYADEGYELAEQLAADDHRGAFLWARGLIAAQAGDAGAARRLAAAGIEVCRTLHFESLLLQLHHVLGLAALAEGDHAAAAAELVPLMRALETAGLWEPGMVPAQPDAIEAAIGAGLLAEAARWLSAYEDVGRRLGRPRALACGARCRGLLQAAEGDVHTALATLERALAEHERLPVPFERARTLLALGTVQRRAKQRSAARTTLQDAAAAFDAIGSPGWAARARAELARIGGRGPRQEGLSATELRVAALVAEGRTNRETAAALFVSVRAVEANLSRVYEKLGVRSRTELAARLHRDS